MSTDVETDRTGELLTNDDTIVVIEVVGKTKSGNVYLCQDYIKSSPELKSGAYFVTAKQLEVMIVGYGTGLWLDNLLDIEEN